MMKKLIMLTPCASFNALADARASLARQVEAESEARPSRSASIQTRHKKLVHGVILALMMFSLSGCVPAVIVAGATASATAGGAVVYDKRTFKTMNQDHTARSVIQHQIDHDPMLKGHSHITVSVFNHTALLVGQAQTSEIRDHANQLVANTKYIKRVYNEVIVAPPTSALQRTNDSWITTKVRAAMLGKPGLASTNLKVITENGVVYLMGIVGRQQADLAADVARRISGVSKVVKVFEYE